MTKAKNAFNVMLPAEVYQDFKMLCGYREKSMTEQATELFQDFIRENSEVLEVLKKQKKFFADTLAKLQGQKK